MLNDPYGLGSKLQLITWLCQSHLVDVNLWCWSFMIPLVESWTPIQYHPKVQTLFTHVLITLLACDIKTPAQFVDPMLHQNWWKPFVTWDGCQRHHCRGVGLTFQSVREPSDPLKSVAVVYISRQVSPSCPGCGRLHVDTLLLPWALTSRTLHSDPAFMVPTMP